MKLMGSFGIGTDRTVGNGLFDFDESQHLGKITLNVPFENAFACLGLYLPTQQEIKQINLDNSSWGVQKRGGYIAGSGYDKFKHLLKNEIYMFTEGSVFESLDNLHGRFIDLRPDWNDSDIHSVWRCGQPLFIPVII